MLCFSQLYIAAECVTICFFLRDAIQVKTKKIFKMSKNLHRFAPAG